MTLSTFCRSFHAFCRTLFVTGLAFLMESIFCRWSIIFYPCHLMTCFAGLSFLRVFIFMVTNSAINFCLLGVRDVRECYRRHCSPSSLSVTVSGIFFSAEAATLTNIKAQTKTSTPVTRYVLIFIPHLRKVFIMLMVNQSKPHVKR